MGIGGGLVGEIGSNLVGGDATGTTLYQQKKECQV